MFWRPRFTKSLSAADAASRAQIWRISNSLRLRICECFRVHLDTVSSFLKPIELLKLSAASIPAGIDKFFHSKSVVLLIIPPDLPEIIFSTFFDCFMRFPLRMILILPDLLFSQWHQKYAAAFMASFTVPIDKKHFYAKRSFTNYNFSMRISFLDISKQHIKF